MKKLVCLVVAVFMFVGCMVPVIVPGPDRYEEDGIVIVAGHEPPGWCENFHHRCFHRFSPYRTHPCCGNTGRHGGTGHRD